MRSSCAARAALLTAFLLALLGTPAAAADGEFAPLMESLNRFHGDKAAWTYRAGGLVGRSSGDVTLAGRILTVERFGNFVLRFELKRGAGTANVLVRSAIHPITLLGGYRFELGPEGGALTYLDFPDFGKMAQARATGLPYSNAEPLHAWKSPPAGDKAQWARYELACLGDRLVLTQGGVVVAHYRHEAGPVEGSIGFQVAGPEPVSLRGIQLQMLGAVKWSSTPRSGDLAGEPIDGWQAQGSPPRRIRDREWSDETAELLRIARGSDGFRPLFDGEAPGQWHETASFWSVENGVIRGASRNNFLVTQREFADFVLRAQVRVTPPTGNSGIQVRSRISETGMAGYQVDMAVFERGGVRIPWWGQIYGEELDRGFLFGVDDPARRLDLIRHGDWNDVVIACRGNHLVVEINGEVTADLVDYHADRTGKIGFQLHVGPQMTAEFREVRILEL